MSNELKAAHKALGEKSILDIESPRKKKKVVSHAEAPVRRKRVPKTEVVAAIKEGKMGWNLAGVDAGAYKVSAPKDGWVCKCGRTHVINPKTVMIMCWVCKHTADIEKGKVVHVRTM